MANETANQPAKKYFVGKIKEVNGEREYTHQFRFNTSADPEIYMDTVAQTLLGCGNGQIDGNGYFFNGGCFYCEPKSVREIDEDLYKTIAPFIEVM